MGPVRVLRLPFPLVLGTAAAPAVHAARPAHVGFALTGAKADERQVLLGILPAEQDLGMSRAGQVIIGDKNYYGRDFKNELASTGSRVLLPRPARKGQPPSPAGRQYPFKPLRQVIESVNDTLKGQLDLEQHGGRTVNGVTVRILQRILALTAAIWHYDATGQPVMRSLVSLRPLTPESII